jgi:hypothetical protein
MLDAELGPQNIAVPRLQAARADGRVYSLFPWQAGQASVIPPSDLVLIRRRRRRRGFFLKREVEEEGLVEGKTLRAILAAHSEARDAPLPLLVYRAPVPMPQEVASELEVLPLVPLQSVKRTHLVGVIDFHAEPTSKCCP